MRILITGGCGFLGSHLVEHFLKHTDADIVVLDKLTYASNGFDRLRDVRLGMAPDVFTRRVLMLGCDLSQPIPRGVAQEIGACDFIIHAAAESHVDNSIADPLPFLQSNVIGTHHLLTLARSIRGLQRIFMVSTDEVYGPAPFDPLPPLKPTGPHDDGPEFTEPYVVPGFHEEARFRPANPYAASKAGGECVAMAYANTYNLPITIVNTMNLIGERQHPEKFVPKVIRSVLNSEQVLIHADPSCTRSGTRFYLHCRTFANALGWLIDHSGMPCPPLKIHVCGEREISNLDLAVMIAHYVRQPLIYKLVDFHSSRPGHDLRYAMDDRVIQAMGWERPMNLEQSLEKTVGWYLRNRSWLNLE